MSLSVCACFCVFAILNGSTLKWQEQDSVKRMVLFNFGNALTRGVVVTQVCVMRLVLWYSVVCSACASLSRFTTYSRQIPSAKREQNA